uniref:Ig-like domain-containing protein n=1 Tax=Acrobeloides nanus TaxID=290746 RepID=A0A914DRN1_9BILA
MERPNFENIKTSLSNYRLSISEVSVNSNSYYNSGVDGNRNEYLSVKKDDRVVVINDLDVDRVYCQDLKTRDFGYVSTHILNAINENFNNFRTQNELKENPGGTPMRQNSSNSTSQISSNPEGPLLKHEEFEFISYSSNNSKPIWEKLWEKSQIKKISIAIFLILFFICVIIIIAIFKPPPNPFILPLVIEPCSNQTFIQGESVKIRCWVLPFKKFNDSIQIEWSIKDDNHFLDGAKNQNGTLVFSSIDEDDTGCYTCQAWDLETDLTASQTICLQVKTGENPNKPQGNYKTIKHKIDHDMEGPKHVSISPSNGLSTNKNPLKAGSNDYLWCGSLNEDPLKSAKYTHTDNTVYHLNKTVFIENHKAILNFSNTPLKDIKTGKYQCYIERTSLLDHEGDQFLYSKLYKNLAIVTL